jgi:hypothetical protein
MHVLKSQIFLVRQAETFNVLGSLVFTECETSGCHGVNAALENVQSLLGTLVRKIPQAFCLSGISENMASFMDDNLFYFYFTLSTFSRHTILDPSLIEKLEKSPESAQCLL